MEWCWRTGDRNRVADARTARPVRRSADTKAVLIVDVARQSSTTAASAPAGGPLTRGACVGHCERPLGWLQHRLRGPRHANAQGSPDSGTSGRLASVSVPELGLAP